MKNIEVGFDKDDVADILDERICLSYLSVYGVGYKHNRTNGYRECIFDNSRLYSKVRGELNVSICSAYYEYANPIKHYVEERNEKMDRIRDLFIVKESGKGMKQDYCRISLAKNCLQFGNQYRIVDAVISFLLEDSDEYIILRIKKECSLLADFLLTDDCAYIALASGYGDPDLYSVLSEFHFFGFVSEENGDESIGFVADYDRKQRRNSIAFFTNPRNEDILQAQLINEDRYRFEVINMMTGKIGKSKRSKEKNYAV